MQCESVNAALSFLLGHILETVDAVLLYSFQGLLFFLTCSTFCRRPHRRTLSSGCDCTGSHLSQGSSSASQVKNTGSESPAVLHTHTRTQRCLSLADSEQQRQNRRPAVVAGADLLRMSRDDLVQICGPADGIRLFNTLKGR